MPQGVVARPRLKHELHSGKFLSCLRNTLSEERLRSFNGRPEKELPDLAHAELRRKATSIGMSGELQKGEEEERASVCV